MESKQFIKGRENTTRGVRPAAGMAEQQPCSPVSSPELQMAVGLGWELGGVGNASGDESAELNHGKNHGKKPQKVGKPRTPRSE